ncbi:hypothetical protein EMN47_01690 [Prolixibacteraceae bacterium JC049]|jgi:NADH:ubiquinone oxidoreductase subunit E|nr:hypothetical protein [Prolixibacteraceae bacterium JC049]
MEKVDVKICYGTMCYVMGGSHLEMLKDHIPAEWADRVHISASPCLDLCHNTENGKAPFVSVNGKIVSEANIEKVISTIKVVIKDGLYQ